MIRNAEGRIFVQRRSATRQLLPGVWDIVGGHIEPNETPEAALSREITEETGWHLRRIIAPIADWEWEHDGRIRRELDYIVEVDGDLDSPALEAGKHDAFAWVGEDDLDLMLTGRVADDSALRDIVAKAIRFDDVRDSRYEALLQFLRTIDQLKSVEGATYIGSGSRHESVAEHTWHMCMFALLLIGEVDERLDLGRVLKLVLIHDLAEILAGNPFPYDVKDKAAKKARERQAMIDLVSALPEDVGADLLGSWEEVEGQRSPEARFAKAIDRLQPFAQNTATHGRVWRERHVTESMSRQHNRDLGQGSTVLEWFKERLYSEAGARGMWPEDGDTTR